MGNYDLVLFDLDGTLTDPQEGIINSIQYAISKMGLPETGRDQLTCFIGPPLQESFQSFFNLTPEQAWQGVQFYREYFAEKGIFENAVFEGIPEQLSQLDQAGLTLMVATSKPTVYSEKILDHFNLTQYFKAVVGSNLDGTRVDKTEVIQFLLAENRDYNRGRVIMVGDRKHDIIGAKNNGLSSLGVTWGYGSRQELIENKADFIIDTVPELAKLLSL